MIDWEKIDFKGKTSGEVNLICPGCSHERKPSNQKSPCLHVNLDKGVGKCHHCGDITVKNPKKQEAKNYDAPPQEWSNYTSLSDKMTKWFTGRGISQRTILDCKITEEKYYQPVHGHECTNIVFNYFEGDTLVNKKYRSPKKKFTQTKNAKKMFYGINDVVGESECYIVEGEMDKLAMWEIGIKNCISVPNGANDLNNIFDTCGEYLEGMEKIYIAVDNDEPGQKLETELLKRFGKWRCEKINFRFGKDANDELMKSPLELEESVKSPVKYPVDGSFTAMDVLDKMLDIKRNGRQKLIKILNPVFQEWNNVFTTVRGQLTTITGIPKHGKSHFTEDYVLNLANEGSVISFFSPEHYPMEEHQIVLCEKTMGRPYLHDCPTPEGIVKALTEEEIEEFAEWSKDKIYLTMPGNGETVSWSWLLEKFKEQMFQFGVDVIVIDAFNKVRMKKPGDLGEINQILADLTTFAQMYCVSVYLIAHPKKPGKKEEGKPYPIPDLYDVKGSGDFHDQTHNGLVVYRHFEDTNAEGDNYTDVINLKTKFKYQGTIGGAASFRFDIANGRFYPKKGKPNRDCLFKESVINQEPKSDTGMVPDPNAWIEPIENEEDFI